MIDVDRDCERMRDFLTGRLTGRARHRFEQRLLRDRSLASDLAMVTAFREGLFLLRRRAGAPPAPAAMHGAATIAAIRHLEPRAGGFVHCHADFSQLASGRNELVLRPEPGSQAPSARHRADVRSAAGPAPG